MKMISVSVFGKDTEPLENSPCRKNGQEMEKKMEGELERLVVEHCILTGVLMSKVGVIREENNVENRKCWKLYIFLNTFVQSIRFLNNEYRGKCH